METIREQIIAGIVTAAADITTANGYNIALATTILRAETVIPESYLPCLVVWPQPETSERQYGMNVCTMPVKIEGFALFGSENPSVISEQILGDIIFFMTSDDPIERLTGGLADDIAYTGGGSDTTPGGPEDVSGAYGVFEIKYETVAGDPYTQAEA